MLKKIAVLFCFTVFVITPCFAGYDHCPFSEEEARREGWSFRDGRPIGEDELLYASISTVDKQNVFRIHCYYRRGYDSVKKIFAPNIVITPKSKNWTVEEGLVLWCTESAKTCTWQIIA